MFVGAATDNETGEKRCQQVRFRFLGLWDTVLSTNWSGTAYNLGIPNEFLYVAQAVALNEYRGNTFPDGRPDPHNWDTWGAFPMESIMGGIVPPSQTRIEQGFLGSHSDIGGSFMENELSKVALFWMVRQADLAGVQMKDSPLLYTVAANPVLHDKSTNIQTGAPVGSYAEDRIVRYLNGTTVRQREMVVAGMSYADTEQFITYKDRSDLPRDMYPDIDAQGNPTERIEYMSNETGTVNMAAYLDWLRSKGYGLNNLVVQ